MNKNGLSEKELRKNIEEMRGGERVTSPNQEEQYKALEKYGVDLVKQVKSGKWIQSSVVMKKSVMSSVFFHEKQK